MSEKQLTPMQKAIEDLDEQMNRIENSKKGKDKHFKYGCDAAITNLVFAKIRLKNLLPIERKAIEDAVWHGHDNRPDMIHVPESFAKDYFEQTFKTEKP